VEGIGNSIMLTTDPQLAPIEKKLDGGQRLTAEDASALFRSPDLLGIGRLAARDKARRAGAQVTYVVNRQINPTNICIHSCAFCNFSSKEGRPEAYVLTEPEILARLSPELKEVHIVGALYAGWSFEDYLDVIRVVKRRLPSVQVKAYTAVEVDFFASREKSSVRDILIRLKEAGVVCLPGGGAEIFSERVRKALFPSKIGWPVWSEVHRRAHGLGLRSNATMLYGHIETPEERADHLLKLRTLQDETGGFLSFIPLAFQPGWSGIAARPTSVVDDLKTIAASRLVLDNFDHIKAYWVTAGEDTCSMALRFGADDVDGTIGRELVMHAAGALSPVGMARDRIEGLIRDAGFIPAERDALHNIVRPDPDLAVV